MSAEDFERLRTALESLGQVHLFDGLDDASDEDFDRFASQLLRLDSTTPGGLVDYCTRGRSLIASSVVAGAGSEGEKEFGPPKLGEKLRVNKPLFEECEEIGIGQAPLTAFVLVAGGLGERLSFDGAKVALETETLTRRSFLEMHCAWIKAFQDRARIVTNNPDVTTPFAIMTSDDTHKAIRDMMSDEKGEMLCGLTDVTLVKQEKVPCFSNVKGELALNPYDRFDLVTKPHGHGDLHSLLHKSGLVDRWVATRGIEWIVVFQDTNALAMRAVSACLGSSVRNRMDMTMVAVQRKRGEAIGCVCNVRDVRDGSERTLNVEYNLVNEDKFTDRQSASSNVSLFPGNINLLVFKASSYLKALNKSGGIVPEFINPKFADKAKTEFKSPARLECMMQDFPLLLDPANSRVGYIEIDRFMCFSAVKNNLKDALTKFQETGYAESASSCESDIYSTCRKLLAMSGCQVRTTALPIRRFAMLPFEDGARVVLGPSFGTTVAEIRSRFPQPQNVFISDRSALVLDGDIIIHHLHLDGHLVIKTTRPGARIVIKQLRVINEGSQLEAIPTNGEAGSPSTQDSNLTSKMSKQYTASDVIRGFHTVVRESLEIVSSNVLEEIIIDRPF